MQDIVQSSRFQYLITTIYLSCPSRFIFLLSIIITIRKYSIRPLSSSRTIKKLGNLVVRQDLLYSSRLQVRRKLIVVYRYSSTNYFLQPYQQKQITLIIFTLLQLSYRVPIALSINLSLYYLYLLYKQACSRLLRALLYKVRYRFMPLLFQKDYRLIIVVIYNLIVLILSVYQITSLSAVIQSFFSPLLLYHKP